MGKVWAFVVRLAALALVLCASGSAQKLPWHPRQGEALSGVNKVVLVSPTVHVEKWSARTGREAEGTADYVRRVICGSMDQLLEERRVAVEDYPLCLGESEASLDRRQALAAAGMHFRAMANDWSTTHHTEQRLEAFRLGDELAEIKKLEVDALILVDANGILTTKGEKALSAIGSLGGGPGQSLVLRIGVIRPQTGELVYFTEHGMGGDFVKNQDKLEGFIEKTMGSVFGRSASPQGESKP